MSGESADVDTSILETRYRAKRNQSTLNIELGITGSQNTGSGSQGGGGGGTVGGSPVVGVITGGGGSGGTGACFLGDTPILLPDMSETPIESIKVGSLVKAPDENGVLQDGKVLNVWTHEVTEYMPVAFADGRVTNTRFEHKYREDADYRAIGKLEKVKHLKDLVWVDCEIKDKWFVRVSEPLMMYNLEVEIYRSYVANGDWVSNAKQHLPLE